MHCMETQQGIASAEIVNGQFLKGERGKLAALVAYVVTHSKGKPVAVSKTMSERKAALETAERRRTDGRLRVEREDLPAAVFLRDIQELAVGQYA